MKVCFYLSDQEIIQRIGYDALIFLRFHRLALRCIVKMSIFSFLVLLPLNYTGGGGANAEDIKGYVESLFVTDFLRFTMANVIGGSPRLWVHCFAVSSIIGNSPTVEHLQRIAKISFLVSMLRFLVSFNLKSLFFSPLIIGLFTYSHCS